MQTGEEFMDDFLDKDDKPETLASMESKSKDAAVADKTSNSFGQTDGSQGAVSEIEL